MRVAEGAAFVTQRAQTSDKPPASPLQRGGRRWRVSSLAVSPRLRVSAIVAVVAALAAGLTMAATVLTRTDAPNDSAQLRGKTRAGETPLVLDLGVRTDPEAVALRRAAALYGEKHYREAARIFSRYDSVEARIGAALSAWPGGFDRIAEIARERPASGAGELALGLGLFWQGRGADARAAWRRAKRAAPDSLYAVRAADFLPPRVPGTRIARVRSRIPATRRLSTSLHRPSSSLSFVVGLATVAPARRSFTVSRFSASVGPWRPSGHFAPQRSSLRMIQSR